MANQKKIRGHITPSDKRLTNKNYEALKARFPSKRRTREKKKALEI